jgi:predicted flavoprotein YhiN
MQTSCDLAIIGAGAAGLAAGIFAAETAHGQHRTFRTVILDSAKKIGAKILVSGCGRCNVTHDEVHPGDFHGSRNIVRNVLAAFDERATVRWFPAGVPLKRKKQENSFQSQIVLALFEALSIVVQLASPFFHNTGVAILFPLQVREAILHGTARARRAQQALATGRSRPWTGVTARLENRTPTRTYGYSNHPALATGAARLNVPH